MSYWRITAPNGKQAVLESFGDPVREERNRIVETMRRDLLATFCLGKPGECYPEDEWNRRADVLHRDPTGYLNGAYDDEF